VGISYEIELTSADYQERSISVQGGLRTSYTPRAEELALPSVHTSDRIAVVAQARLPQLFRDEGAFDRRAYLRSQGIDLTAALRSLELLERIAPAKLSPRSVLAAVPALRTDTNGAVHIITDGERLEVSCFIACPEINAGSIHGRRKRHKMSSATRSNK
jgi:hypothetical protein